MENGETSRSEAEALNRSLSLDVFDADDNVLIEAGLQPAELPVRFSEDKSRRTRQNETDKIGIPILTKDLRPWMMLLLENVKEVSENDIARYRTVLDPQNSGAFEFYSLLKVAGYVVKDAERIKKEKPVTPSQPAIANDRILRPRRSLRKPARVIFYEKFG